MLRDKCLAQGLATGAFTKAWHDEEAVAFIADFTYLDVSEEKLSKCCEIYIGHQAAG